MAPRSSPTTSPGLEHALRRRDAVDDLVVDRDADRLRVAAVARERGLAAARRDAGRRDPVDLLGRPAGAARRDALGQRLLDDAGRALHLEDLGLALAGDHAAPCRDGEPAAAGERPRRPRPSSTGRSPSIVTRTPACAVEVGERSGLLAVDAEALGDRLFRVVGAPLEDGALEEAVDERWRPGTSMKSTASTRPPASPRSASSDCGLRDRARIAVEDRAVLRVRLGETLFQHLRHEVVRHERARLHDRLRDRAERRPAGDVAPQEVARRDLGNPQGRREPRRLGSLARAGRAEENDGGRHRQPRRPRMRPFLRKPS